jgi:hypothetical protein
MFETISSINRNLRAAVGRHAVAAGLSVALAAAVAGVGAGFAIAASANANPSLSAAAVTAAATTTTTGNASTGAAAARPIIRGLIALTAKDTGQTLAQMRSLLRQGESLDQIAGSHAAAVVASADATVASKVAARESAGKLSASQASALEARADSRITQVMAAPGQRLLRALQRAAGKTGPSASRVASPEPSSGV